MLSLFPGTVQGSMNSVYMIAVVSAHKCKVTVVGEVTVDLGMASTILCHCSMGKGPHRWRSIWLSTQVPDLSFILQSMGTQRGMYAGEGNHQINAIKWFAEVFQNLVLYVIKKTRLSDIWTPIIFPLKNYNSMVPFSSFLKNSSTRMEPY